MSKVICIPPISSTINQRVQALQVFSGLGFLDVAMVYRASLTDIFYETFQSFTTVFRILKNPEDSSLVFPDKLKDLNGMHYKVPYFYQPPIVDIRDGALYCTMLFFLQLVGIAQNAKFDLIFLSDSSKFIDHWLHRVMHLTLNSGI